MLSVPKEIIRGSGSAKNKLKLLRTWIKVRFQLSLFGIAYVQYNQCKFKVYPQNYQILNYIFLGNSQVFEAVLRCITSDTLFIDIGANVGIFSLGSAAFEGCEVVAIEPVRSTFTALSENIELNPLLKITCLKLAVSNQKKTGRISSIKMSGINSLVNKSDDFRKDTEFVFSVTLDDVLSIFLDNERHKRLFLKIDVERHEFEVLRGGIKTLSMNIPIKICFEYYSSDNKQELSTFLAKYGFVQIIYEDNSNLILANESNTYSFD